MAEQAELNYPKRGRPRKIAEGDEEARKRRNVAYVNKWRSLHPERLLAYNQGRREVLNARSKAYYEANKEARSAYMREYNRLRREKAKQPIVPIVA